MALFPPVWMLHPTHHAPAFDFLVLGGGVAGLSFALEAAQHGSVAVLTKRARAEGNTTTPRAASPRCSRPGRLVRAAHRGHAGRRRRPLQARGGRGHRPRRARADRSWSRWAPSSTAGPTGEFDLTREGGHTRRRVVHAGDITGREVERALLAACDEQPNIRFFPDSAAIDLILDRRTPARPGPRCLGAYVLLPDGEIETFLGKVTVLATGGAGKVYLYTTNPDVATGDGVAMAYRAGAQRREHGVLPVPPHLPLPPRGEELPHPRGAARRGRHAAAAQRRRRFMERYDPLRRARAARHRGARHRRRDEAHRRRAACSST